jgi:hypothetical protein
MCNLCESWSEYIARVNAAVANGVTRPLLPYRCNMHVNAVSYYLNMAELALHDRAPYHIDSACKYRYHPQLNRFLILEDHEWFDTDHFSEDGDNHDPLMMSPDMNMILDNDLVVNVEDRDVPFDFNTHSARDFVNLTFNDVGVVALYIDRMVFSDTEQENSEGSVTYEIELFDSHLNPVEHLEMREV